MNVLITGGTGFIGSRLVSRCLERGDIVKVLGQKNTPAETDNCNKIKNEGAQVFFNEITDADFINNIMSEIDIVFHLAAAQHEMNIPDKVFWDVNVEGTKNILEASINSGVQKFIHGSTIGVYGILDGLINEKSPCIPDNIYGTTKLAGEKLALSYKDKIHVSAIRIPETYGPGDRRLLKLFKAIKKKKFPIIGKGNNLHHLIYVDDLINGFFTAADNEKSNGEVFLLSGKKPVTTNEMVDIVAKELGVSHPGVRIPIGPVWFLATIVENVLRPLGIQPPIHRRRIDFFKKSFSLSSQKVEEMLGFFPKVNFNDGVKFTAEWYKKNNLL
jgi:nucleoside-diphosphate-sugar epimerase